MLYISNATTQHYVVHYREPVENLMRAVEIGSGRQAEIGHGWDATQIAEVIKQLERYGARDAAEVHKTVKKFHGLIYRDGAPVSGAEIQMGHESVQVMQNDRSVEQTVNAALGADRAANPQRGRRSTKRTEVSVEQVLEPGTRATGNETKFSLVVDAEEGAAELKTTAA